jgi:5-methylcytosine-specific restriction endonuclease McrA
MKFLAPEARKVRKGDLPYSTIACSACGARSSRPGSHLSRGTKGPLAGLTFCNRECQKAHFRTEIDCTWPGCEQKRLIEGAAYRRKQSQSFLCVFHTEKMKAATGSPFLTVRKKEFLLDVPILHQRVTWSFVKYVVFELGGGTCTGESCGASFEFSELPRRFHIDHREPMYRGGLTRLSNLQLLCVPCHVAKTSAEMKDVNRTRWKNQRVGTNMRSMSHHEKDALIARLRARLEAVGQPAD